MPAFQNLLVPDGLKTAERLMALGRAQEAQAYRQVAGTVQRNINNSRQSILDIASRLKDQRRDQRMQEEAARRAAAHKQKMLLDMEENERRWKENRMQELFNNARIGTESAHAKAYGSQAGSNNALAGERRAREKMIGAETDVIRDGDPLLEDKRREIESRIGENAAQAGSYDAQTRERDAHAELYGRTPRYGGSSRSGGGSENGGDVGDGDAAMWPKAQREMLEAWRKGREAGARTKGREIGMNVPEVDAWVKRMEGFDADVKKLKGLEAEITEWQLAAKRDPAINGPTADMITKKNEAEIQAILDKWPSFAADDKPTVGWDAGTGTGERLPEKTRRPAAPTAVAEAKDPAAKVNARLDSLLNP